MLVQGLVRMESRDRKEWGRTIREGGSRKEEAKKVNRLDSVREDGGGGKKGRLGG
jgi:hypothetical protein